MSDNLRRQIYSNLNLKTTDDLLEIWQANDRTEWSDSAFDAIEEILKERNVEAPLQSDPNGDSAQEGGNEDYDFSELELKIIDDETPPDFYDPFEVLKTSKNLDYVAKIAVGVSLLSLIPGYLQIKNTLDLMFFSTTFVDFIPIVGSFVLIIASTTLQIIFTYYPLKALAHILRTLMKMEFSSRKAK